MNYRELQAKLTDLEAEITAAQAAGEILTDARIDSSKTGGMTARGQPSTQNRLRMKGQKAHYLKASEVAATRAAMAMGPDRGVPVEPFCFLRLETSTVTSPYPGALSD